MSKSTTYCRFESKKKINNDLLLLHEGIEQVTCGMTIGVMPISIQYTYAWLNSESFTLHKLTDNLHSLTE